MAKDYDIELKRGDTLKGWEYQGGNVYDKNNWKRTDAVDDNQPHPTQAKWHELNFKQDSQSFGRKAKDLGGFAVNTGRNVAGGILKGVVGVGQAAKGVIDFVDTVTDGGMAVNPVGLGLKAYDKIAGTDNYQQLVNAQKNARQKAMNAVDNWVDNSDSFAADLARNTGFGKTTQDTKGFGNAVQQNITNRIQSQGMRDSINRRAEQNALEQQRWNALSDDEKTLGARLGHWGNIAGNVISNPLATLDDTVVSATEMVGGGRLLKGANFGLKALQGTKAGAKALGVIGGENAAKAAITEGLIAGGHNVADTKTELGDEFDKAAALKSGLSGVTTGAIALGGNRLGRALGVADIDEMLVAGAKNTAKGTGGKLGRLGAVAKGAVQEGLLEELPQGMAETALQNWATGKPITDGMAENAISGAIAGGLMGGSGAGVHYQKTPELGLGFRPASKVTAKERKKYADSIAEQQQAQAERIYSGSTDLDSEDARINQHISRQVLQGFDLGQGGQRAVDLSAMRQDLTPSHRLGLRRDYQGGGALESTAALAVDSGASFSGSLNNDEIVRSSTQNAQDTISRLGLSAYTQQNKNQSESVSGGLLPQSQLSDDLINTPTDNSVISSSGRAVRGRVGGSRGGSGATGGRNNITISNTPTSTLDGVKSLGIGQGISQSETLSEQPKLGVKGVSASEKSPKLRANLRQFNTLANKIEIARQKVANSPELSQKANKQAKKNVIAIGESSKEKALQIATIWGWDKTHTPKKEVISGKWHLVKNTYWESKKSQAVKEDTLVSNAVKNIQAATAKINQQVNQVQAGTPTANRSLSYQTANSQAVQPELDLKQTQSKQAYYIHTNTQREALRKAEELGVLQTHTPHKDYESGKYILVRNDLIKNPTQTQKRLMEKYKNAAKKADDTTQTAEIDKNLQKTAEKGVNQAKSALDNQSYVSNKSVSQSKNTKDDKQAEVSGSLKGKVVVISDKIADLWVKSLGLKSLNDEYIPKIPQEVQDKIGKQIKVKKGSLLKLITRRRTKYIPEIKPTFETPDTVIKDKDGLLFIKQINDDTYFVNVNIDKGDYWVSISQSPRTIANIENKFKAGAEVLYRRSTNPKTNSPTQPVQTFTDFPSSANSNGDTSNDIKTQVKGKGNTDTEILEVVKRHAKEPDFAKNLEKALQDKIFKILSDEYKAVSKRIEELRDKTKRVLPKYEFEIVDLLEKQDDLAEDLNSEFVRFSNPKYYTDTIENRVLTQASKEALQKAYAVEIEKETAGLGTLPSSEQGQKTAEKGNIDKLKTQQFIGKKWNEKTIQDAVILPDGAIQLQIGGEWYHENALSYSNFEQINKIASQLNHSDLDILKLKAFRRSYQRNIGDKNSEIYKNASKYNDNHDKKSHKRNRGALENFAQVVARVDTALKEIDNSGSLKGNAQPTAENLIKNAQEVNKNRNNEKDIYKEILEQLQKRKYTIKPLSEFDTNDSIIDFSGAEEHPSITENRVYIRDSVGEIENRRKNKDKPLSQDIIDEHNRKIQFLTKQIEDLRHSEKYQDWLRHQNAIIEMRKPENLKRLEAEIEDLNNRIKKIVEDLGEKNAISDDTYRKLGEKIMQRLHIKKSIIGKKERYITTQTYEKAMKRQSKEIASFVSDTGNLKSKQSTVNGGLETHPTEKGSETKQQTQKRLSQQLKDKANAIRESKNSVEHKNAIQQAVIDAVGAENAKHIEIVTAAKAQAENDDLRNLSLDFVSQIEGFASADSGKITLIQSAFDSPAVAAFVAWHELGHRGIEIQGRKQWHKSLRAMMNNSQTLRRIAGKKYDLYHNKNGMRDFTAYDALEESIVDLYAAYKTGDFALFEERNGVTLPNSWKQQGKENTILRMWNAVRAFFSRLFGRKINSDREIFALLRGLDGVQGYEFDPKTGSLKSISNEPLAISNGKRYSLSEKADSDFIQAIDSVAKTRQAKGRFIHLGTTPKTWQLAGIPNVTVSINDNVIRKVMGKWLKLKPTEHNYWHIHNLTPQQVKSLPKHLNSPIAVFKSAKTASKSGYLVLTELTETDAKTGKQKPVVVALHLDTNKKGEVHIVDITSAFGGEDNYLKGYFRQAKDLLKYWDKNKGRKFLTAATGISPAPSYVKTALVSGNVKTNDDLSQVKTRFSLASNNKALAKINQNVVNDLWQHDEFDWLQEDFADNAPTGKMLPKHKKLFDTAKKSKSINDFARVMSDIQAALQNGEIKNSKDILRTYQSLFERTARFTDLKQYGKEELQAIADNPNFQAWFAKAHKFFKNTDGTPKVFYRGLKIDKGNIGSLKNNASENEYGAEFFTDNAIIASTYSTMIYPHNGFIQQVAINAEKPFIVPHTSGNDWNNLLKDYTVSQVVRLFKMAGFDTKPANWDSLSHRYDDTFATSKDTISFFVQTSVKTGFEFVFDKKPDDQVYQKQFDTAKFSEIWERPEWFSNNFFVRNLQSRGKFDSVIFKNIHDNGWQASQVTPLFGDIPAGTVIAVWGDKNNQAYAKELGNKGTFSKEDKRIFYSLKNTNPEPIPAFGENFDEFYHKGQQAVEKLLKEKHGQVVGAFYKDGIGDITLAWGVAGTGKSDGWGLAKIAQYHPEMLGKLEQAITETPIVKTTDGRYQLENAKYKIGIRREFDGVRQNWILTAFERNQGKENGGTSNSTTDFVRTTANATGKTAPVSNTANAVTDNIAKTTPTVQELKTSLKALKATAGQGVFDSVATMIKAENAFDTMHEDTPKALKYSIGKSAQQASIAFGRELGTIAKQTYSNVKSTVQKVRKNKEYPSGWRVYLGNKWQDSLNVQLQFLGRRHIVDIFDKVFKGRLKKYSDLVSDMDAMKNSLSQKHDDLVRDWGKLPAEENDRLVDLMHKATLAQYDPDTKDGEVNYKANWNNKVVKNIDDIKALHRDFNRLSPDAKKIYRQVRDNYKSHYKRVQVAMQERILRLTDGMDNTQRKAIVEKMNAHFEDGLKGVYFPLQRFGDYVVVAKDKMGKTISVSRAESANQAEEIRREYLRDFPKDKGYSVLPVQLSKDYVQSRDGAGRAFVQNLIGEFANRPDLLDGDQFDEVADIVEQMWLASMPDLSWAKHGIHRKGTAGYSDKARRAYAQNMIHGTNYLARLTYSDQLQTALDEMQGFIDSNASNEDFNHIVAQRVQNEMEKRHENLMRPNTHPLATKLTGLGFVWYLGLSPASALVNLTQTWLVGLPVIGAKYGNLKTAQELLKASGQTIKGAKKDGFTFDISGSLTADEKAAFDRAVADGTIDTSQAYDLAGIEDGHEDAAYFKYQRFMRGVAKMFHEAEVFNRQATFIAVYRLARQKGMSSEVAYQEAKDLTYKSHFDYATSNRARILQGNWQRVIFLFKQFGFNMLYTVYRNAYVGFLTGIAGTKQQYTKEERKQARQAVLMMGATHFAVAGALGLPLVGTILSVMTMLAHAGGADDDWDAEEEMKKAFASVLGKKGGNAVSYGLTRYLGVDLHGRLGLHDMIFPDVQENLEGQDWAESFTVGMSGAVVGMGVNFAKGLNQVHNGEVLKGAESMLPTASRNAIKSYRLATQGQIDRTGVVVKDDFNAAEIATTAIGFNPASLRRAMEAKSAILNTENRKNKARTALMSAYAKARMDGDKKAMQKVLQEINEWNRKNPTRRIEPKNLQASLKNRQRRITNAKHGVYLSDNHQDAYNEVDYAIVD